MQESMIMPMLNNAFDFIKERPIRACVLEHIRENTETTLPILKKTVADCNKVIDRKDLEDIVKLLSARGLVFTYTNGMYGISPMGKQISKMKGFQEIHAAAM